MISALAGEIEAYKEEQNRSWIPSFVEDCARTRFVKHVDSYSDVVSVIRNYMREKEEYVKHKEALERYEKMLVKRSYRSAGLIIDHLVSYHSSRTQLPFDRIAKMVDINERYKMDDGYRYVTVPSHIKVELGPETPEGAAGVEVIVTNGTRKTLATPDGIIMLFIDTRVKGDDKRLLELYQNKANMLWAALSSRTLGEMYLAEPNFILYGIDSEGIHPSAAIARK
jgi:hypothetical protein